MTDYLIALDNTWQPALVESARRQKVDPKTHLLGIVQAYLTSVANELGQAARDAKVAALDAAKDSDTKAIILSQMTAPRR